METQVLFCTDTPPIKRRASRAQIATQFIWYITARFARHKHITFYSHILHEKRREILFVTCSVLQALKSNMEVSHVLQQQWRRYQVHSVVNYSCSVLLDVLFCGAVLYEQTARFARTNRTEYLVCTWYQLGNQSLRPQGIGWACLRNRPFEHHPSWTTATRYWREN